MEKILLCVICMMSAFLCGCAKSPAPKPDSNDIEKVEVENTAPEAEVQELPATSEKSIEPKIESKVAKPISKPRFSFRGAFIGDDISLKDKDFDGHESPRNTRIVLREENGFTQAYDNSIGKKNPEYGWTINYLGDIPVEYLYWWYLDNKLVGFEIEASSNLFAELKNMVIAKYGEPFKIENGTVQNKLGATFPQTSVIWNMNEGVMILENPSSKLDKLRLTMSQYGLWEELANRNKKIAEKKAKDAF
jgi:hypothetical protein